MIIYTVQNIQTPKPLPAAHKTKTSFLTTIIVHVLHVNNPASNPTPIINESQYWSATKLYISHPDCR